MKNDSIASENNEQEKLFREFNWHTYKCPIDFEGMKEVIQKGFDMNAFDDKDKEPFAQKILLREFMLCDDWDNPDEEYCEKIGDCRLCSKSGYMASLKEVPKLVIFLLENGFDVSREDGLYGAIALYSICQNLCTDDILEGVRLLLEAGANPYKKMYEGRNTVTEVEWLLEDTIDGERFMSSNIPYYRQILEMFQANREKV